jgi:Tol biopolymer transport system component
MATSTPTTVTSSVSYTLLDAEDNLVLTGVDDINGTGNSLNNHITGNVGANILDGAVGADTLEGGAGDDIYVVDDGNDVVVEQANTTMVTTILVSVDENGVQGSSGSFIPVFSPDGTKIAFEAGEINSRDIFVKDLNSGLVTLVSTDSNGVQGDNGSHTPVFSPDGTKIAFASDATNLVAGDTSGNFDIFVKDLSTGLVTRVSTDSSGVSVGGASGGGDKILFPLDFSPDGTKIAFVSSASNLVAGDTNGTYDIFVKDLNSGLVTRVSTDSNGVEGNNDSYSSVFSPDGTKIAFASNASNLVAGDTNGTCDIFVKDLNTGLMTRVSTDSNGLQGDNTSYRTPMFSPDGTKIAFTSAANLVVSDAGPYADIFVKDLNTGLVTLVSTNNDDVQGNSGSYDPVFSPDGTKVVFLSHATNLVAGDTNGDDDIFVKDLNTGLITRVSTDSNGVQGNSSSHVPVFSPDGTQIAFQSDATNLVAGDTNNSKDVFLATLPVSNSGIDTVNSTISYTLPNNVENLNLLGADSLSGGGNELNNVISGSGGGDFLSGYAGDDTILGMDGNDYVDGGSGDDRFRGR